MYLISVVTPCYNEEDNVSELYERIKDIFCSLPEYSYEHIFIDNCSTDKTVELLKSIASKDNNVKVIVNSRNFGYIRSPYYGLLQAKGDAAIFMASDLQDPPQLIPEFIKKWEAGYKIVLGIKVQSEESPLMFSIRNIYYNLVSKLSEIELNKNTTGFGLYDKQIISIMNKFDDPYPWLRGIISEIGFETAKIEFLQPLRKRGITKSNFYKLYDAAMLGITNHSKVPLRIATMLGFSMSILSLFTALCYFIAKLLFWKHFSLGIAPIVIGFFFISSVLLFFIGILGEYIGSIHTLVLKRPLVIEKERINFD